MRHLALVVADEDEIGAACGGAVGAGLVRAVARRNRRDLPPHPHRRSDLAPIGAVFTFEMAFFGALVRAGGDASPRDRRSTPRVRGGLILVLSREALVAANDRPVGDRAVWTPTTTTFTKTRTLVSSAAGRGRCTVTRNAISGRCRGTTTCCKASRTARRCRMPMGYPWITSEAYRVMSMLAWTTHICGCVPWCPGLHHGGSVNSAWVLAHHSPGFGPANPRFRFVMAIALMRIVFRR